MKIDWFYTMIFVLMLPLVSLGVLEVRNHLVAGPLREWVVDANRLEESIDLLALSLSQRRQLDVPDDLSASMEARKKSK